MFIPAELYIKISKFELVTREMLHGIRRQACLSVSPDQHIDLGGRLYSFCVDIVLRQNLNMRVCRSIATISFLLTKTEYLVVAWQYYRCEYPLWW